MQVDVASPSGGLIPVEPLLGEPNHPYGGDDRLLGDAVLRAKINDSLPIASVDIDAYDIVYLRAAGAQPLTSVSPSRLPPRSPKPTQLA